MEIAEIIILCIKTIYHRKFFWLKYRVAMYQTSVTSFLQLKICFFPSFCIELWLFECKKLDFHHNQQRLLLASITLPNLGPKFDLLLGYDRPGSILMCHGSCCYEYTDMVELFPTFIYDSETGMMAAQPAAKLFCNLISLIFRSQVRLG